VSRHTDSRTVFLSDSLRDKPTTRPGHWEDAHLIRMKRQARTESLPEKQITVLLAEDHASFRKSLRLLIESDGKIKVVGEAKNGREALRLTWKLLPDVVVMDIAMPLLNGLQATRQIMGTSPATKVLILSAHPDPEYIEQAMIFGASGYLLKQSSTQVLAQAVREVKKGNAYFSTSISSNLRDQCRRLFGKGELQRKKAARQALSDESSPRHGVWTP
jgi:DNA-binding NarL/FixJ family response regulator